MLEHSKIDLSHNNSLSRLENTLMHVQNSFNQEHAQRKRIHTLMTENFELKQMINSLQNELKSSQQVNNDLRIQLRTALEEIGQNDKMIEQQKSNQKQFKQQFKHLQCQILGLRQEIQEKERVLVGVLEHNKNLETEIQLLSQIKQKYQLENTRYKAELQKCQQQFNMINCQNEELNQTFKQVVHQYEQQEQELVSRRQEMKEYQAYVLSKLTEAKNDPQFHQKCRAEKDKYYCKYLKYKQKCCVLKHEKDELLRQIVNLNQEVGSDSMRKYVQ